MHVGDDWHLADMAVLKLGGISLLSSLLGHRADF